MRRFHMLWQATVGRGWVATLDHPLIVRKAGDPGSSSPAEAAPCCRVSPEVVAMQEGRPISDAEYRSRTAQQQATGQLGWSDDYWQARSGGGLNDCSVELFACTGSSN